jgi:hypothetical protein
MNRCLDGERVKLNEANFWDDHIRDKNREERNYFDSCDECWKTLCKISIEALDADVEIIYFIPLLVFDIKISEI